MKNRSAIIIGAGLTGLTTAFYLKRGGWKVTLLEQQVRPGGSIQTFRENGFIFESGPNTGIVSQPEVADLLSLLGAGLMYEPANPDSKKRLIWKGCRWHNLPANLKEGINTPLFSWRDKLKIVLEPFRKKGRNPDETLSQLVKRRLGKSFLDYAVDPFILGVYAGDPSQLVTRFAFPKLYNLEQKYGSFIKGSLGKFLKDKNSNSEKVTMEMFSITGGLDHLITTLVQQVGPENVIFNCKEVTIYPKDNGFAVSFKKDGNNYSLVDHHVITTTGANQLRNLLPFMGEPDLKTLTNLVYAKVVQVAVGFRKWRGLPLKAFGGLIPHKEKRDILGILFPSSFLKERAPEGGALLSVFMGGIRNPEMVSVDDETIKSIVMRELNAMLMIPRCEEPDLFKIFRHQHAIPQYSVTTRSRLNVIAKIESQFPGLILAGNLRDGVGMADRIKQGTMIANQLLTAQAMVQDGVT